MLVMHRQQRLLLVVLLATGIAEGTQGETRTDQTCLMLPTIYSQRQLLTNGSDTSSDLDFARLMRRSRVRTGVREKVLLQLHQLQHVLCDSRSCCSKQSEKFRKEFADKLDLGHIEQATREELLEAFDTAALLKCPLVAHREYKEVVENVIASGSLPSEGDLIQINGQVTQYTKAQGMEFYARVLEPEARYLVHTVTVLVTQQLIEQASLKDSVPAHHVADSFVNVIKKEVTISWAAALDKLKGKSARQMWSTPVFLLSPDARRDVLKHLGKCMKDLSKPREQRKWCGTSTKRNTQGGLLG